MGYGYVPNNDGYSTQFKDIHSDADYEDAGRRIASAIRDGREVDSSTKRMVLNRFGYTTDGELLRRFSR